MSGSIHFEHSAASRAKRLKISVLASFYARASEVKEQLAGFGLRDWERILYWLDISGLALYLLDRLTHLELGSCMPAEICARFEGNLDENQERTDALFKEAAAISDKMMRRGVEFALIKGITLTPESVPDSALRSQTDLDFLVAACDATSARRALSAFGYGLHAVCGNTMEFYAGQAGAPDSRKIYRVHSQRALELHMLSTATDKDGRRSDRLFRAQRRNFGGHEIPTLAAADIFVQQSVHLFKHLCGEHTRASWVLEFCRHIEARRNDAQFWREVKRIAACEPQGELALSAALMLTKLVFGKVATAPLTEAAIEQLPHKVRLWIESFGLRVLLTDSTENKLYLILRKELRDGSARRASIRRLIFPTRSPQPITHGVQGERLSARLARYRTESRHFLVRFYFHVVEGLKYAIELSRWQRRGTETLR